MKKGKNVRPFQTSSVLASSALVPCRLALECQTEAGPETAAGFELRPLLQPSPYKVDRRTDIDPVLAVDTKPEAARQAQHSAPAVVEQTAVLGPAAEAYHPTPNQAHHPALMAAALMGCKNPERHSPYVCTLLKSLHISVLKMTIIQTRLKLERGRKTSAREVNLLVKQKRV